MVIDLFCYQIEDQSNAKVDVGARERTLHIRCFKVWVACEHTDALPNLQDINHGKLMAHKLASKADRCAQKVVQRAAFWKYGSPVALFCRPWATFCAILGHFFASKSKAQLCLAFWPPSCPQNGSLRTRSQQNRPQVGSKMDMEMHGLRRYYDFQPTCIEPFPSRGMFSMRSRRSLLRTPSPNPG